MGTAAPPAGPADARIRGGWALALLVSQCLLWGVQQNTVKLAIAQGFPRLQLAALRTAVAATCLTGWIGPDRLDRLARGPAWAAGDAARRLDGGVRALLAVAFAGEFMALNLGLRLTTASREVLYAVTTLLVKAVLALSRASASRLLLYRLAGSAPLLVAASLAGGEPPPWPRATLLPRLVLAGAAPPRQPHLRLHLPGAGVRHPGRGALLPHEPVGWPLLAGFAAIATGLTLLNRR